VLRPGITFCDMIFISGTTLVVDEGALTGESKPLSKTSIDQVDIDSIYDPGTHKRQTILAGTTIIDCREGSLGLVMKTGSFTTKGEMLREILSYHRHKFKFDVEVQLVLVILLVYGIFGFLMTGFVLIIQSWIYGWFYGIYVLACVLSALLPTVFLVSVGISEKRLINKNIACSNSKGILVAGKVNKAIFDKTGTLTKDGLEFLSSRSKDTWEDKGTPSPSGYLGIGMACCHTLTQLLKGVLIGNLVDKVMFQATGAKISLDANESPNATLQITITMMNGEAFKILKQFDFDHQR
jgi:magnesium-transporting ATPase (P-type)